MKKNKLPLDFIAILKNISRRCSLQNASFGEDKFTDINGNVKSRDEIAKESIKIYLKQDTKGIVDAAIEYAEGKCDLRDIQWGKTL